MRYHKSKSLEIALAQAQISSICQYSWEDESCLLETSCCDCHRYHSWLEDVRDLDNEEN